MINSLVLPSSGGRAFLTGTPQLQSMPPSSPPPSRWSWSWLLFTLTVPSIPDVWRHFIDSRHHTPLHKPLLAVHRSFKAIYNLIFWLSSLQSRNSCKKTSELGRALNHASLQIINHPITSYRDDENEDAPTTPLLRSNQSDQVENDGNGLISASAVWRVDWIIRNSKQLQTTKLAVQSVDSDPKELAEAIIALKKINPILCPNLEECLLRIRKAVRIRKLIQERSDTTYAPELHRHKFKQLLSLLKPNQDYDTLPPKGWQEIGFQGTDPSTDLRGAGILGLDALIVFGKYYGSESQKIVTEAVEGGQSWYPWALASINVTWWCISLAKKNKLDYFLLGPTSSSSTSSSGSTATRPSRSSQEEEEDHDEQTKKKKTNQEEELVLTRDELHEFLVLQCQLTYLFHRFWCNLRPKPSVMQFEFQFNVFKNLLLPALSKGLVGALDLGWILDQELHSNTHPSSCIY